MKKILCVFGTRPEAIKFAPLIKEIEKRKDKFELKICVTGQHRHMLDQILDFFKIHPDYDLNLMMPNQDLISITSGCLNALRSILVAEKPDLVIVQGDTTTAFAAALGAYYQQLPVAHLEAGLRSYDKFAPFPEELNRRLISSIADFHFAPTVQSFQNLQNEGIKKNIYNVGNTVIDALYMGLDVLKKGFEEGINKEFRFLDFSRRIILVTCHRRESFGKPFNEICLALREVASTYNDVQVVFPVHPNPNVRKPSFEILSNISNIYLIDPINYPSLIYLMSKCFFVLTDSGGIQEEAPSLGKPVLVLRDVTERTEGIEAGTACLVGTSKEKILKECFSLLNNENRYDSMSKADNPYGDGHTAERIIDILISDL